MKKKIWIINHYAGNMFLQEGGRHFWFAERLKKNGYEPTILCASTIHNSNTSIDTKDKSVLIDGCGKFPFVFIKTPDYQGNGRKRIMNMYSFYKNIKRFSGEISDILGVPDIIYASSVHPLTLVAGIKIAKRFGIPCICEVRDLWPLGLIEYGIIKDKSLLASLLYKGEKWIYKKADAVIMTVEGCRQYIKDMGWEKEVDINKVHYINNGIVIKDFDENIEDFQIEDEDLIGSGNCNIVYTGSIRKANDLNALVDAAEVLRGKNRPEIKILVFGEGDEREALEKKVREKNLTNIVFKGEVDKKYVASIVSKANVNILHRTTNRTDIYGQSQNKLFDYMAAGKPIFSTYDQPYNLVKEYDCGTSVSDQTPDSIADGIIAIVSDEINYEKYSHNAREGAKDFDFDVLTEKLIRIIEESG